MEWPGSRERNANAPRDEHRTRRNEEENGGGHDTTRHVEAIHYSTSTNIRVGGEHRTSSVNNTGFWPVVLEGFSGKKLMKEEADCAKRRVREVTGGGEDKLHGSSVSEL